MAERSSGFAAFLILCVAIAVAAVILALGVLVSVAPDQIRDVDHVAASPDA